MVCLEPSTLTSASYIKLSVYKPGGADPYASQRIGVFLPATSKLFADTILTFVGFTVQEKWKKNARAKLAYG